MKVSNITVEGIGFHKRGIDAYLSIQLGGDVFELLERRLTEEELAHIIDEAVEVAEQLLASNLEVAKMEEG